MIDFFCSLYHTEAPRTDKRFGINDGAEKHESGKKYAYTVIDGNENSWNAVVDNSTCRTITFIPIDHNIEAKDADGNQISMCDGLLYSDKRIIVFVELKDRKADFIKEGLAQLKSTLKVFLEGNDLKSYHRRYAYISNRSHPQFKYSHKVVMQQFRNETGVRLLIQKEINIQ